jgi:hypothetical protein
MIASADRGRACLTTNRLFGTMKPSASLFLAIDEPVHRQQLSGFLFNSENEK